MRRNATSLALLTLALCTLTAHVAHAREWRVTLGGHSTRIMDSGVLATTGSGWVGGVDAGFQVEVGPDILVGLAFATGNGQTTPGEPLFDRFETDLFLFDLLATARWHIGLTRWLRPFVEIGVGASRASIDFQSMDLGTASWAFVGSARAGLEFRLPPGLLFGGEFSLGLDLSGGYTYRTTFDMNDASAIDLGELDLHGGLWRIGLAVMW